MARNLVAIGRCAWCRGHKRASVFKITGVTDEQEAYRVESASATCLISGGAVDLRGYCGIDRLLDFKLET